LILEETEICPEQLILPISDAKLKKDKVTLSSNTVCVYSSTHSFLLLKL